MGQMSESRIRVRYVETDQMGVVYHANYFVWFEIGRTDFIRILGVTYSELEQRGLLLPVVEANCKYKQPAKYDDELIIQTTIREMKGVRLTFDYQVIRAQDGQTLVSGFTQHVFSSPDFKPFNLRSRMPDLYELLNQSMTNEV
jgi:acyl-CoA thioester hydrolase